MAPIFNVRRHTGSDFESGAVHRARGINEAVPGVDVVDGREEERSWAGGNSNFSESDGRRRKLRDTQSRRLPHRILQQWRCELLVHLVTQRMCPLSC